jgi:hypothetical protein
MGCVLAQRDLTHPAHRRQIERTLLVVDGASAAPELHEAIALRCAGPGCEVFVVGPHRDQGRVARCLGDLAEHGIFAWGRVGAADPLTAIAEALRDFDAEEIVIASDPAVDARRLGTGLARRASLELGLPVTHIAVGVERPLSIAIHG